MCGFNRGRRRRSRGWRPWLVGRGPQVDGGGGRPSSPPSGVVENRCRRTAPGVQRQPWTRRAVSAVTGSSGGKRSVTNTPVRRTRSDGSTTFLTRFMSRAISRCASAASAVLSARRTTPVVPSLHPALATSYRSRCQVAAGSGRLTLPPVSSRHARIDASSGGATEHAAQTTAATAGASNLRNVRINCGLPAAVYRRQVSSAASARSRRQLRPPRVIAPTRWRDDSTVSVHAHPRSGGLGRERAPLQREPSRRRR